MLRIYSKGIQQQQLCSDNTSDSLKKRSNLKWDQGTHAYPAVDDVDKYAIVVTTLSTIGKYALGQFARTKPFTYIFIDECGASSEPEALIAITAINFNHTSIKPHFILCGDHKQLGPVIKSRKAAEFGLKKSLMERLLERKCYAVQSNGRYNTSLQARLKRNFRSHSEIMKLYNRLYYESHLIPLSSSNLCKTTLNTKWSFFPNSSYPYVFQAVYGECVKGSTHSWYNKLEIEVLIAFLKLLLKVDGVNQNEIGVITPYKSQSELIETNLGAQNLSNIEVGSVENFQGREKRVIIASMVRSNCGLGFIKCPQRWNVLLSRPKSLLLILGNPYTLNKFEDIKFVITECERAGNYLGKNNFIKNESSEIEIVHNWKQKNRKSNQN